MTITANPGRFVLTFHATGSSYTLSAEEAQRLLDGVYPAVKATRFRVLLPGHNTGDPKQRCTLQSAIYGGGPAFTIHA